MPWGKVDDNHYDHPKVLSIPRAIRNAADGLYWRGISRCNRILSDGWLSSGDLDVIDSEPELVDALVTAGLWERKADGRLRIHDYLVFNKSRAEVVKERRQKEESGRAGGLASGRTRAKRTRSKREAPASPPLEADANENEAPGVELPTRPDPSRPVPSGSYEPDAHGARALPDEMARHGLPHLTGEAQRVIEAAVGRMVTTCHGWPATELDRLLEERPAALDSVPAALKATGPHPSWAQFVQALRDILEPLPRPDRATDDAARREAEKEAAWQRRVAATKARTAAAREAMGYGVGD